MIKNDRQYAVTKRQIQIFEEGLAEFTTEHGARPVDPIKRAQRDALESQLSDLREQLRDYEALLSVGPKLGERRSLDNLPDALIEARIAAQLTQRQLAERLELKEQQIQRYEATDYVSASLSRILDIVDALDDFFFTFQLQRKSVGSSDWPIMESLAMASGSSVGTQFDPWAEPPLAALATPSHVVCFCSVPAESQPTSSTAIRAYSPQSDYPVRTCLIDVTPTAIGLSFHSQKIPSTTESTIPLSTHDHTYGWLKPTQEAPGLMVGANWARSPVRLSDESAESGSNSVIRLSALGRKAAIGSGQPTG